MLTATRDPFHSGAPDASLPRHDSGSRLTRTFTVLQVVGSLVAIPIGLVSAYSMYHATFSVESSCQSLRGNIVTMLDKSLDATTRRMLVRRDVEVFERSCGAVDPDATAAFKALLAADKTASPVSVAVAPAVDVKPKESVRKAESRPAAAAKQTAAKANPVAAAAAAPALREDPVPDALWLDAVRQALVNHTPAPAKASEPVKTQSAMQTPPAAVSAKPLDVPTPAEARVAPVVLPDARAPASTTAPVLPPPETVAKTTAEPRPDAEHPVPPQAIPDSVPPDNADAARPDEQGHPRIRRWVAKIPLMGNVINNGW